MQKLKLPALLLAVLLLNTSFYSCKKSKDNTLTTGNVLAREGMNVTSYYLGKQYGFRKSFYESGRLRDVRSSKDNIGYGPQIGFWEDGVKKFEFFYMDGKICVADFSLRLALVSVRK